jgi:2-keto-4-pentenoate hydratase
MVNCAAAARLLFSQSATTTDAATREAAPLVTTGTCIVPLAIAAGDEVTVDYGVLGAISCRIV